MPVQIPKVQRLPAQAPQSVGRIQTPLPDGSKQFAQTTGMIVRGTTSILDEMNKAEKAAIDVEAVKLTNQFRVGAKALISELRNHKGNPTPAFQNYDNKVDELYNSLLAAKKDSSPRAKAKFERSLNNAKTASQLERLTLYGQMSDRYDHEVTSEALELNKKQAIESVGYIDLRDEKSFGPFDSNLGENLYVKVGRAYRQGAAVEVPEGYKPKKDELVVGFEGKRVLLDKGTVNEIAEDESKTVRESIEVLLSTENMADYKKAKAMMDRYGKKLVNKDLAAVNKKFGDVKKTSQAYEIVAQLRNLTPDKFQRSIDRLDPELRSEVLKIQDADTRRLKAIKDRDSAQVMDKMVTAIIDRGESNKGEYTSFLEFQNDPGVGYKQLSDRLTGKQRESLRKLLERPRVSNRKVLIRGMDAYTSGLYKGMSAESFMDSTVGLNKSDYSFQRGLWKESNKETTSQQFTKLGRLQSQVFSILTNNGVLERENGRYTDDSREIMDDLKIRLAKEYMDIIKQATPNESVEIAQEVATNYLQERKDNEKTWSQKFNEALYKINSRWGTKPEEVESVELIPGGFTPGKPSSEKTKTKKSFDDLSDKEQDKFMDKYEKETGVEITKDNYKDFEKWYYNRK